jgi:hypothetical protein
MRSGCCAQLPLNRKLFVATASSIIMPDWVERREFENLQKEVSDSDRRVSSLAEKVSKLRQRLDSLETNFYRALAIGGGIVAVITVAASILIPLGFSQAVDKAVNDEVVKAAKELANKSALELKQSAQDGDKIVKDLENIKAPYSEQLGHLGDKVVVVSTGEQRLLFSTRAGNEAKTPVFTQSYEGRDITKYLSIPPNAKIKAAWFNVVRGTENIQFMSVMDCIVVGDKQISLYLQRKTPDQNTPDVLDLYFKFYCAYVE